MDKTTDDTAPARFDGVDKRLLGIMIVGMLLMAGSGAWYFFG